MNSLSTEKENLIVVPIELLTNEGLDTTAWYSPTDILGELGGLASGAKIAA